MNVLIQKATIIQPYSKYHGQRVNLWIKRGKISKISKNAINPEGRYKTITGDNLHISAGWVDIGAHTGEPGHEYRETLESLDQVAQRGGYTHVALMPTTVPVVDTASAVRYITSRHSATTLLPLGSVTVGAEGQAICEMLDLSNAGAVAYTDGIKSIQKSGVLLRALQYLKHNNGVLLHHPTDASLAHGGHIHEGSVSTSMGLPGIPAMAEDVMVQRDIELAYYAEAALVFHAISTRGSVKAIRRAQKNGHYISATVAVANLTEEHDILASWNTDYKVSPPIRSAEDRKALIKGIRNRTIQAIVSNHTPLESECKQLEFPYADDGMISLETTFALLCDRLLDKGLELEDIIYALSEGPRSLLHLEKGKIEVGADADLTVFDPTLEWQYDQTLSLSNNTPYLGQTFTGKAVATIH